MCSSKPPRTPCPAPVSAEQTSQNKCQWCSVAVGCSLCKEVSHTYMTTWVFATVSTEYLILDYLKEKVKTTKNKSECTPHSLFSSASGFKKNKITL